MFEGFFDLIASILNFFYTLIPSYGASIMLLTVLVMVLITPLTVKSTRSMLQMQRLAPEMKRIQAKYKNDREKLNEELMKFYRENQINPLGGCLPLLAQMPVFIIMYQLLRGLTVRQGGLGSGVGHIGAQLATGESLTPWVYTDQLFRPLHLNHSTELYQALSHTNDMKFFGVDLSISAAQAWRISLVTVLPYLVLLLIMLGTGIYQNRQLQARNTSANVNPQQQMLMKVMPFFLPVFAWAFPAGLALYWCTQNVCRIGTNAYITRSVYRKEHQPVVEAKATEAKGDKGSEDDRTGAKGSGGKGAKASGKSTAQTKGNQAKGNQGKGQKAGRGSSANGSADEDRGPGKSVRSQKARRNASGGRSSGGGGSGTRRKSGEPRKGGNR